MSSHSIHTQSNSARTTLRFGDRRTFRSSHGHRSGDRNRLHCLDHGRVAVMMEDKPSCTS